MQKDHIFQCYTFLGFCLISVIFCKTDSNDLRILNEFKNGLKNPEILQWPNKDEDDDPCGNKWKNVYCSGDRVTQIQVQNLGIIGTLPMDFNQLTKLENLGFQRNKFHGKLPSFSGLSELKYAFLDYNNFDEIPLDFFDGLINIQVLALDNNPLNFSTGGWNLPNNVGKLTQLVNFSSMSSNLVGDLPEFLGFLPNLNALKLANNNLSGFLPLSFNQSLLQILWLNNQVGEGFSGPIDVIAKMPYLSQVWLHGNRFTGTIPTDIGNLTSLRDLNLNGNRLVGVIPDGLASLELDKLDISNNMLMGAIPKFKSVNVSYHSNSFCQSIPGVLCSPQVNALIDFLSGVNYPSSIASEWSGNNPCEGPWLGVSCDSNSDIIVLNLPNRRLNGTLNPSIGSLGSLRQIRLGGNHLTRQIPVDLTKLKSLTLLDVSDNDLSPPIPKFRAGVSLLTVGNPLLVPHHSVVIAPVISPPHVSTPHVSSPSPTVQSPISSTLSGPSRGSVGPPPFIRRHFPGLGSKHSSGSSPHGQTQLGKSKRFTFVILVAAIVAVVLLGVLMIVFYVFCCKKKNKATVETPGSVVAHPKDPDNLDDVVKVAISRNDTGSVFTRTASSSGSGDSNSGVTNSHLIESGNLVISVQVLRKVTNNFTEENLLGRGGFGSVYKGELGDGTKIAVKRMEAGVINSKQLDEFQAEIAVLSKVRHRHLVSLFGYATEGNERLLVYEYLPEGALSKHLFHWKSCDIEPLSWKTRLSIALDVARGMEYLHTLAQQSFIHRDLKSSNILLDEKFRAKVSDFGLVKLAPDKEKSVATRLAGTFGYLAPEYAVTGKITTKVDVFSYGVVLMELLTGLVALDEDRSEETRYLAEWFGRIKSNTDHLLSAIDPALNIKEDAFESITIIADLAGHCTARDPNHRPDMGHAVSVLTPLVDKWKPFFDETEDYLGIDYSQPLKEMLQVWQKERGESKDNSCCTSLDDSRGSIPAKPTGFADSFTSADAR
ncbi:hypothetical protein RND81_04G152200 [Saponaria officinalis]|uniref:Protein kinase domain-containing protein n=1 Tax=Saponaria officinalis TaxID=3572 RepID=A0AAW1LL61_SAPOF